MAAMIYEIRKCKW